GTSATNCCNGGRLDGTDWRIAWIICRQGDGVSPCRLQHQNAYRLDVSILLSLRRGDLFAYRGGDSVSIGRVRTSEASGVYSNCCSHRLRIKNTAKLQPKERRKFTARNAKHTK